MIGNYIYVLGGYKGANVYSSVDVYDTKTNTWGSAPDIPTPTCHASAAVINDTIYLIGDSTPMLLIRNIMLLILYPKLGVLKKRPQLIYMQQKLKFLTERFI